MSKNDRKTSKREFDAAIRKLDRKLSRDGDTVTRFVKSINPDFVNDETLLKLVAAANGKVVETIPFADGSNQFRVDIRRGFLDALKDGSEVMRISAKPFTAPSHDPHPRQRPEPR